MADKVLYSLSLPEASQTNEGASTATGIANQGLVSSGTPSATATGTQASTNTLSGQFRGDRARTMTEELLGLFGSPSDGHKYMPLYAEGSRSESDGYYVLGSLDTSPLDPRINDGYYSYKGSVTFKGTRRSHLRTVTTVPTSLDNDFGNDQNTYVGVDARANNARWVDEATGATEAASPVATRQSEFGAVDIYDVDSSGKNGVGDAGPPLSYDLPYEHEGKVDVTLWDDGGSAKTDANGELQWRRAFATSSNLDGVAVMDNGLLRVYLDGGSDAISVESWDSSTTSWSVVSLGTSDWVLRDKDLFRASPAVTAAQCVFEDTANPGTFYTLNGRLRRGADSVLWTSPDGQSGVTPQGLIDLLTPVASTTLNYPNEETGLLERGEVRK